MRSNSGSKFANVLHGDSSPLDSYSFKWQWRDWDRVNSNCWFAHCPLAVCHSPRYSNYFLDGFLVPPALRFQSSDFTSSEFSICIPSETFCFVVSHSKPNPELQSGNHSVHGICGDLLCEHFLTKWDKLKCQLLARQSLEWRLLQ